MSPFPPEFDESTLTTDDDRRMRAAVLEVYSDDAADYVAEKYRFPDDEEGWNSYVAIIQSLLAQRLPEAEFIDQVQEATFQSRAVLF